MRGAGFRAELTAPAKRTTTMPDPTADSAKLGSGAMFDAIAERYDLLNRLMSMGIDHRWRKKAARALALSGAGTVIDVATGTGDLALAIARMYRDVRVVGVDPAAKMLAIAEKKISKKAATERVRVELGDAQNLAFGVAEFDGATIAFGIRNVPDRAKGLAEMRRVVRPGGKVVLLELNEPKRGLLSGFARFYIHHFVPRMGAWLSGKREYRYLQQSIAAFPPPAEFCAMMTAAGLTDVRAHSLTFGVATLFVGTVPAPATTPGSSAE